MATLRDLVLEVQEAAVVEGIARFYDQRETQWLPDAVADVLGQLRKLAPDPCRLSVSAQHRIDASRRSQGSAVLGCRLHQCATISAAVILSSNDCAPKRSACALCKPHQQGWADKNGATGASDMAGKAVR